MSKEEILKLRQKAVEFTAIDDLLINLSVPAKHVLFLIDENQRLLELLRELEEGLIGHFGEEESPLLKKIRAALRGGE